MANQDHLKEINVYNQDTGQSMTCTVKQFNSLYKDKGFVEVDRNNAESAAAGKAKPNLARPSRGAGSTAPTSAKDIAKNIGIESDQPADEGGAMTFSEAAKDTAERNKDTAK